MRLGDPHGKVRAKRRRRRRGGGGRWRAFVRMRTAGCSGRPRLGPLGAEYRQQLSEDVGAQATAMGRLATIAHRDVTQIGSSFGPNGRQLRRRRREALRLALWQRLKSLDEETQIHELAKRLADIGDGFFVSSTTARAAHRFVEKQRKAQQAADEATLAKWLADDGRKLVDELTRAIPGIPKEELHPIPSDRFKCFEWQAPTDRVGSAMALAAAEPSCGVAATLDRHWDNRHGNIMHSRCEPILNATSNESACFLAGYCVCSPNGQEIRRLHARLLAGVKQFTPRATTSRDLLLAGNLVAELCSAERVAADGEPNHDGKDTKYFHVAGVSLSPYKLALHRLDRILDLGEVADGRDRVYLKVSGQYSRLFFPGSLRRNLHRVHLAN